MISKAEAARELLRRSRARRSLLDFILYLNPEYIISDFSREVCSSLEEFYRDVSCGLRPVLVIGAPPQHGKSEMVSRYLPAWLLGKNPDLSLGGLSYGSDLDLVTKLLYQAVDDTPRVLDTPRPRVNLMGFGNSSVDFEVRFWILDPEEGMANIRSDIFMRVWQLFKEHDIEIPFPQRDLHLRSGVPVEISLKKDD